VGAQTGRLIQVEDKSCPGVGNPRAAFGVRVAEAVPMIHQKRILPSVTFKTMTKNGPKNVQSKDIFAGKNAILFAVTGAFTPPCHYYHLPEFLEQYEAFKSSGVDLIACTATNDIFVLDEWAKASGANDKILFLADGNMEFAIAMGLVHDCKGMGLGIRSSRYAMWIVDCVIQELHVECDPTIVDFTSAAAMMQVLSNARDE
jgi:peroxiredoxin